LRRRDNRWQVFRGWPVRNDERRYNYFRGQEEFLVEFQIPAIYTRVPYSREVAVPERYYGRESRADIATVLGGSQLLEFEVVGMEHSFEGVTEQKRVLAIVEPPRLFVRSRKPDLRFSKSQIEGDLFVVETRWFVRCVEGLPPMKSDFHKSASPFVFRI
jgi:hypothetical protein